MVPNARIDLSTVQFTPELIRTIPTATVRMYRVLPVFEVSQHLVIALADPSRLEAIDELHFLLGRELQVFQADPRQIEEFINRLYG